MKLKIAALCALSFAAFNASACFTVYDRTARVIYQGLQTPVDMSRQFHETLGRTHPGAHLVFDDSVTGCTPISLQPVSTSAAVVTTTSQRAGGRTRPDRH